MEIITRTLGELKAGEGVTIHNLTMVPLFGRDGREDPGYMTLDEALAARAVRITEVSAGGSVPELAVVNEGSRRVLIVDGEELVGAKQNRVLNLTVLVPAGGKTVIPVSCVEAGRWRHASPAFAASEQVLFCRARARKVERVTEAMCSTGERRSDQGEVWHDIADKLQALEVHSPTSEMRAAFQEQRGRLEDYVRGIAPAEGQTGALFAIGGGLVGLDLFDHPRTLAGLLPKLVRSVALDAIEASTGEGEPAPIPTREAIEAPIGAVKEQGPPSREAVDEFLGRLARAEAQAFPAIGEGEDLRLRGPGIAGAALAAAGRVVHLGAFRMEQGDRAEEGLGGGFVRASRRRGFYRG